MSDLVQFTCPVCGIIGATWKKYSNIAPFCHKCDSKVKMERSHNGKILHPASIEFAIFSSRFVINNWNLILTDPFNNRPDIKSPEEYITEAKAGNVTIGGLKVIVQDELPKL